MPVTPKRAATGKAREAERSRCDLQDVSNTPSPSSSPKRKNRVTGAENEPPSPRTRRNFQDRYQDTAFENHATASRARAGAANLMTAFERMNLNDGAGVQALRTPQKPKRQVIAPGPTSPVRLRDGKIHVQSPVAPSAISTHGFKREVNRTFIERFLHGPTTSSPWYRINSLAEGPSGAHGSTRRVQIMGYDGRKTGGLAWAKLVKRQRVKDTPAYADLRAYGRIARATTYDGGKNHVMDLEAFVDVPTAPNIIFVLELAMDDMFSVLCDPGRFDAANFVQLWAVQLISGLGFLHSIGIIHRDMKPENCVLDWNNRAKITDLDMAFVHETRAPLSYDINDCHRPKVGTPGFTAPEIYRLAGNVIYTQLFEEDPFESIGSLADDPAGTEDRRCYGAKVDFFSTGVLLFDIFASFSSRTWDLMTRGRLLHELVQTRSIGNLGLKSRIPAQFDRFLRAHGICDSNLGNLLALMVDLNPETRADFQTIRDHPYFVTTVTLKSGEKQKASLFDSPDFMSRAKTYGVPPEDYKDEMPSTPMIKVHPSVLPPNEDSKSYLWANPKTKLFDFLEL